MKTLMIVCCLLCCVAGCSKDSDYYEKRNRAAWQACIDKVAYLYSLFGLKHF